MIRSQTGRSMTYTHERDETTETIEINPSTGVIALLLSGLGVLSIAAIGFLLLTKSVPLPLIALLITTAAMLIQLTLYSMQALTPTHMRLDDSGLTMQRLLGTVTHPWADIATIKLVHSGGDLSDDPRSDVEDRIAVGLFLKSSKSTGDQDPDPDALICTGQREHARRLIQIVELVNAYARKQASRTVDKARKALGPGAANEFKRRPRSLEPAPGTSHYVKPQPGFGRRQR